MAHDRTLFQSIEILSTNEVRMGDGKIAKIDNIEKLKFRENGIAERRIDCWDGKKCVEWWESTKWLLGRICGYCYSYTKYFSYKDCEEHYPLQSMVL